MGLNTVLEANAAEQAAKQAAKDAANNTVSYIKGAIVKRDSAQKMTDNKIVKIGNAERIAAIKESRMTKSDEPLKEILERVSGDTIAPKGNIVVLVVGLGEDSSASDFYKHVREFNDDTTVIGADMFAFNGQSDTNPNDFTDQKFESLVTEVAILEQMQAGITCDVLSKRQPFSDIFSSTLKGILNGN